MQLRLTRRALADLGLDPDTYARKDASEYQDASPLVKAFVERRSQSPEGQERTNLPVTKTIVWNLHPGRYRALTWHDQDNDIVWLLGAGWHELGSIDDVYTVLKNRDAAGTLFPNETDYEDLEPDEQQRLAFAAAIQADAYALAGDARQQPGKELRATIAGVVDVAVVIDAIDVDDITMLDVWVAFAQPPRPAPEGLSPPAITVVLGALIAGLHHEMRHEEDLHWGGDFPRPGGSKDHEIVVNWRYP